jgi:hypothetical protein
MANSGRGEPEAPGRPAPQGEGEDPGGPRPAGPPPVPPARPSDPRPARPAGLPGIGSIFALAFLMILVPGLVAYSVLRLAGLPIGPAGLLGLLVVFVGLGLYPTVLQRLGWVRRRRRGVRQGPGRRRGSGG